MKVMVTAFDPFGGESVNPAEQAVDLLPDQIGDKQITKLTVPTVFGRAGELVIKKMDELHPDAVICVGQAGGRSAVTPERVAINMMDAGIEDNDGRQPCDEPVIPGGPAAYFSTLPIKAMVQAIKDAGLPGAVSNTAGTFVCNSLLYSVLHHTAEHMKETHAENNMKDTRAAFIHVPYIPEQTMEKKDTPSMPLDDIVRALTAAITAI